MDKAEEEARIGEAEEDAPMAEYEEEPVRRVRQAPEAAPEAAPADAETAPAEAVSVAPLLPIQASGVPLLRKVDDGEGGGEEEVLEARATGEREQEGTVEEAGQESEQQTVGTDCDGTLLRMGDLVHKVGGGLRARGGRFGRDEREAVYEIVELTQLGVTDFHGIFTTSNSVRVRCTSGSSEGASSVSFARNLRKVKQEKAGEDEEEPVRRVRRVP